MQYTYLLINFLTIFFPLVLSFDKRVAFYNSWKFIWPGLIATGLFFLVWDVLFTLKGVWSFNPAYITGITIFKLPVEEALFFITVPYACIFIYACFAHYVKLMLSDMVSEVISSSLIIFSVLIVAFNYQKLYTLVTFTLLGILIIMLEYLWRLKWLNRFYIVYIIALIPFYIVNGVLTSIPVVLYNNAQNLGIRIGSVPLEDHFYCMALLLMNIGFYEYLKDRKQLLS